MQEKTRACLFSLHQVGLRDAARAAGPEVTQRQLPVGLARGARGAAAGLADRAVIVNIELLHDTGAHGPAGAGAAQAAEQAPHQLELVDDVHQGLLLAAHLAGEAAHRVDAHLRRHAAVAEAGLETHHLVVVV